VWYAVVYDVLFLHPPAYYDFRDKIMFPGPAAKLVPESTFQFVVFPIGMISIAEYLQRNGYNVKIANLAKRMILRSDFDVEGYIRKTEANIYAVDLHWSSHSQGAIEIARLCKKIHPNALVILGGLTATRFHQEILKNFPFVDGIIRGEAEKPLLSLVESWKSPKKLRKVPNLTYSKKGGKVQVNPLMKPSESLDEYEFTQLDLMDFGDQFMGISAQDGRPSEDRYARLLRRWQIPLCRGCLYNCTSCGGSAYSYRSLLGREKPAVRNPEKIVEDLQKLKERGIDNVFLFQDPRMLGKRYHQKLVNVLRKEKPDIGLSLELFTPADEDFFRGLSRVKTPFSLTISPESGVENVRRAHGRGYSNAELLDSVKLCLKYGVKLSLFFMLTLAEETVESLRETWGLWEKIYQMENYARDIAKESRLTYIHMGLMYLLDPGSLAFDFPEKYGYRLFFKNFKDYYLGLHMPSWSQWISYETKFLTRKNISDLTLNSFELLMSELEEKYIVVTDRPEERAFLNFQRFWVRSNYFVTEEVERILQLKNLQERERKLRTLKEVLSNYYARVEDRRFEATDNYGYGSRFKEILHKSTGLMGGCP